MRSIVVHADESAAATMRLETARILARAHHSHVTLAINTDLTRFVALDPFGGAYPMADAIADARLRAASLETRLSAQMANQDVPFDIVQSEATLVDGLLDVGKVADLVIVSLDHQPRQPGENMAGVIGALAVAAGPPVLALSPKGQIDLNGPAMVAWNNSSEAANTVRAATPLLQNASAVQVVTVAERDGAHCDADPLLRYLSRYDVHAVHVKRERSMLTVEEELEKAVAEFGAQWLVMGAYGHSRVRELLFGGVTRYMIRGSACSLFLSH